MASLTISRVRLTATPTSIPCPPSPGAGTPFVITATVTGQGGQLAGAYDIKLYDIDSASRKTKLDEILTVAVAANLTFTKTHTFNLWCDSICEVVGRLASSGEMKPELQAYVEYGAANSSTSNVLRNVKCGAGSYKPKQQMRRE